MGKSMLKSHLCIIAIVSVVFSITGCTTLPGTYRIQAVDQQGNPVKTTFNLTDSSKSTVISIRNSLCTKYPKATVSIISASNGQNLEGESPFHCP
jgi:uncharacterized lipoprotein NlpE involved in copper resistance